MAKIDSSNKWAHNPRKITASQRADLAKWMDELGDLAGITYCHNAKAYATGNQRSDVLSGAEIVYTHQFDEPDKQGTVALGYAEKDGAKYAYREVRWTEEQFKQACIVANSAGGSFDWGELANDAVWGNADLESWGLNPPVEISAKTAALPEEDFKAELEKIKNEDAPMPIVAEFMEDHEYFVIACDNSIDVEFIRNVFGLNTNFASKDGKQRKSNVLTANDIRRMTHKTKSQNG